MNGTDSVTFKYETRTTSTGRINGYRYTLGTGEATGWHRRRQDARAEAEQIANQRDTAAHSQH